MQLSAVTNDKRVTYMSCSSVIVRKLASRTLPDRTARDGLMAGLRLDPAYIQSRLWTYLELYPITAHPSHHCDAQGAQGVKAEGT